MAESVEAKELQAKPAKRRRPYARPAVKTTDLFERHTLGCAPGFDPGECEPQPS
jgi:hypothetical protein